MKKTANNAIEPTGNSLCGFLQRLVAPVGSWPAFPPSLRSGGNAAVSGDCLLPSLRSGREPGSQDGHALRAAAYRRIRQQPQL